MNNNSNMKNHTRKRSRNWNNNVSSAKRARLNKKGVSFKNSNNIKNLNMSNNAREYRKPIRINRTNRSNLPNYYTNKKVSNEKWKRINNHKEKIRSSVGLTKKNKK